MVIVLYDIKFEDQFFNFVVLNDSNSGGEAHFHANAKDQERWRSFRLAPDPCNGEKHLELTIELLLAAQLQHRARARARAS